MSDDIMQICLGALSALIMITTGYFVYHDWDFYHNWPFVFAVIAWMIGSR